VQHLVRELGSTDNEHGTGYRARQREQSAVHLSPPRQGLQRAVLKRDRVRQSCTTRTPFHLAVPAGGLSGEVTVVRTGDREAFSHPELACTQLASPASAK
jgi:hypothetical protein